MKKITVLLADDHTIKVGNGLMPSSFTEHFRDDENKNSAAKASSANQIKQ